jgi:hypothetical protein
VIIHLKTLIDVACVIAALAGLSWLTVGLTSVGEYGYKTAIFIGIVLLGGAFFVTALTMGIITFVW